jgi:hypothetical protein
MRRYYPNTRKTGACGGPRRLVACFLLSSLVCVVLGGCGAVRVQGFLNSDIASVSGFVSGIHIVTVPGADRTVITITIVTLQQTLGFTTTNFCGNVGAQFPMRSFAQVNFQPGQPCSTIVVIVIN